MTTYNPDWTLPPAAMLTEWLEGHGLSNLALATACAGGKDPFEVLALIHEVIARKPLGKEHAEALERGTGISARMWLGYERQYRADLAAGCKDSWGPA